MIKRTTLTSMLVGALICGSAAASQVVVFEDGRAMQVSRVERSADMILLSLEDGGQISVPEWRISGWRAVAQPEIAETAANPATVESEGAWREAAGEYADLIATAARRHDLDPALLTAVAQVESAFDPLAVSPKGAQGLLQLMPATAERFGVRDAFDVAENVDGGARYLSWLLKRFKGKTRLALAGYNAGERAVERFKGIPPYNETRNYVARVMSGASRLTGLPQ